MNRVLQILKFSQLFQMMGGSGLIVQEDNVHWDFQSQLMIYVQIQFVYSQKNCEKNQMEELDLIIKKSDKNRFSRRNSSKILLKAPSASAHQPAPTHKIHFPSIYASKFNITNQRQIIFNDITLQQIQKFDKRKPNQFQAPHKYRSAQLKYLNDHKTEENLFYITKILEENKIFSEFQNNFGMLRRLARSLVVEYVDKNDVVQLQDKFNRRLWRIDNGEIQILSGKKTIEEKENQEQETSVKNGGKSMLIQNQSLLISIESSSYEKLQKCYIFHQSLKKMLKLSPFFSIFTEKQIETLLPQTKQSLFTLNQTIFHENQPISKQITEDKSVSLMYFLINGEVEVKKKTKIQNNKEICICVLGTGEMFGEECLNENQEKRKYSVVAKSNKVNLVEIERKSLFAWLKKCGISQQNYLGEIYYFSRMERKWQHYKSALKDAGELNNSILYQKQKEHVMDRHKRNLFEQNLKKVQNMTKKVSALKRVQKKRIQAHRSVHFIDFQSPLFHRNDFPQLASQLKRFQNDEKIALKRYKLSKLSSSDLR